MIDQCTTVQIETIAHCTATCPFCPVGFMAFDRPQGVMKEELFRKIVDESVEIGATSVLPFLNGEPLMDSHLFDRMDYIAERGLRTDIFTNGSLLTKAKADRLAQYTNLDMLNFSFHGGNQETYSRVMGLNFERTKANIEYFLSINNDRIQTRVYLLDYEDTSDSVQEFKDMWGKYAFVSQAYFTWGGLTVSQRAKLLEYPPQPCQRLLHHMTFLVDGRASLCCMDFKGSVVSGDANTEHLREIWARIQPLRERHKRYDFDMDLCRDCSLNRYGA